MTILSPSTWTPTAHFLELEPRTADAYTDITPVVDTRDVGQKIMDQMQGTSKLHTDKQTNREHIQWSNCYRIAKYISNNIN